MNTTQELTDEMKQWIKDNHKPLGQVTPEDLYAHDEQGNLLKKVVTFDTKRQGTVTWEPLDRNGVQFCIGLSQRFQDHLENDFFNDPRAAVSDSKMRKEFHGNPDERISGK